jgi:4-aminobutyrate aminotransferase
MGCVQSDSVLRLVEKLKPIMPSASLNSFFFCNSGAEAVENAVKLARNATERDGIIVFQGGYHGRTAGTLALTTSNVGYKGKASGPLPAGQYVVPHPYEYQGIEQSFCEKQLDILLKQQVPISDVAAILIEPVLGEGGYIPSVTTTEGNSRSFFAFLREWCDDHGVLLIADEVQSGFGRTGKMFAVEHSGVDPDILIMAKGIASGVPLSAVATRHELSSTQALGSMGGTYGGNAVSCAAAVATIDAFAEENILDNCVERGEQLTSHLLAMKEEGYPIGQVRGLGLMIGCEFDQLRVPKGFAGAVSKACADRNLLLLNTGINETTRFIPPLVVTKEEVTEGLGIFAQAMNAVMTEHGVEKTAV